MNLDKISIGVIGASAHYGWAKRAHMPALAALPEYELTAICTTSEESAQQSKEFYGAQKAYSDYKAIIADPDIDVIDVSSVTGFPEILDWRVKTLHPNIHGGLLGIKGNKKHENTLKENSIEPNDLLVVNLYPFEETVQKGADFA